MQQTLLEYLQDCDFLIHLRSKVKADIDKYNRRKQRESQL